MALGPLARELVGLPRNERSLARILDAFYRYHAHTQNRSPRVWGDKSPINTLFLERIRRVFPDMAAIHVLRDGGDVVQSFVSTGVIPSLDDAVDRWVTAVRCAQDYGRRHPERYLEVRYETLVSDPEPTIRRVCDLLGLSFVPAMLQSESLAHTLGDVPRLAHHEAVTRPVSADAVGKGRRALSAGDRSRVGPRTTASRTSPAHRPPVAAAAQLHDQREEAATLTPSPTRTVPLTAWRRRRTVERRNHAPARATKAASVR